MIKEREPLFYVAAGEKFSGKTYYTQHFIIDNYIKGNELRPPTKAIIIDINNEYPYKTLPIIVDTERKINTIISFNKQLNVEARKVSVFKKDGDRKTPKELKEDLSLILKYFRNGLIVVEDINRIMAKNVSDEIYGYLCTNRHAMQDILINVQNIGRAGNPSIKSTMNLLRLHHVQESIWRHEDKFDEYVTMMRIAQLIVDNRYQLGLINIRRLEKEGKGRGDKKYDHYDINYIKFYVFIDFYGKVIKGNFSEEEFDQACLKFMFENKRYSLDPLLEQRDRSGKLVYNYNTAVNKCLYDLKLFHYGN